MGTQALLVEVLLSSFFAIACFRARSGSSDVRGLAPKRLFVLTDRIERLRISRWQWCSMVISCSCWCACSTAPRWLPNSLC